LIVSRQLAQNATMHCSAGSAGRAGMMSGTRTMRWVSRLRWRLALAVALAAGVASCSTDLSLTNVTLPKTESALRRPDWATYSGGARDFELRPITAADLVGPDGLCSGVGQASGFAEQGSSGSGISLQMTECEVVRRAGAVDKIDFGVNERGERAVVMTYTKGSWPGVYNFAGGRLVAIERAPGPPPAPAKAQQKGAKKPAGT
jgi:hypothetical protein